MKLSVTLTGTSNEYLAALLPLAGELEILEVGTDGRIIACTFRCEYLDGTLGAAVHVPAREFVYGTSGLTYPHGRRPIPGYLSRAQQYEEEGKTAWTDAERRGNRWRQQTGTPVPGPESTCPYCSTGLKAQCPNHT